MFPEWQDSLKPMGGMLEKFRARISGRPKPQSPQVDATETEPTPPAPPSPTSSRLRAVGIDLGTTYSAAAYISDSGQSTMIRNGDGEILTPSAVLFEPNKITVGKTALAAIGNFTDAVADYGKGDMGSKTYSRLIRGKRLPPEVIQAYILKQL